MCSHISERSGGGGEGNVCPSNRENKLSINHANSINVWITEIYVVFSKPHKIKAVLRSNSGLDTLIVPVIANNDNAEWNTFQLY